MKRTHTPDPERAIHHERASLAAQLARVVKRATKPARLLLIAIEAKFSDDYYADLIDKQETLTKLLRAEAKHRVALSARRQAVERGVA